MYSSLILYCQRELLGGVSRDINFASVANFLMDSFEQPVIFKFNKFWATTSESKTFRSGDL